jgi:hypothetical protein
VLNDPSPLSSKSVVENLVCAGVRSRHVAAIKNLSKGVRRLEQVMGGHFARSDALLRGLPEMLNQSPDVVQEAIDKTVRQIAADQDALWRASFQPAAYLLGTAERPSQIFFFGITGGPDRWLKIPLDLSQPPISYVAQTLAVLRKTPEVKFFGPTTGFIVNYSPDLAIRFDIEGQPVETLASAYRPGEVTHSARPLAHGPRMQGGRIPMGKSKLERHAQEIVPGVWLGGRWACRYAHEIGFKTIGVLESPCCGVEDCFHTPILVIDSSVHLHDRTTPLTVEEYCGLIRIRCDTHLLQRAHQAIDKFLKTGPVLVHCLAGHERSPLVVATWLCERNGLSLSAAYDLIISKRPIVEKRDFWLRTAQRVRYGGFEHS